MTGCVYTYSCGILMYSSLNMRYVCITDQLKYLDTLALGLVLGLELGATVRVSVSVRVRASVSVC